MEDRCPHRQLPLSMGKLVGDALQCHYHGLRFDRAGKCVRVPGQDLIPQSARVRTYPVVERYHWVWIWMGDPALADPAKITDFHWLDDPNWGAKASYLHVEANWQLVVDNLLDLTHLAFVHETTIGNMALVEHAAVKVQRKQDNVRGHPLDHRSAGAADLRQGRQVHRQRRPLADHRLRAAGVSASRCRRHPDRHRRAGGPPRQRHLHAQSQRHHAGDRNHVALLLGPGARFRCRTTPRSPSACSSRSETAFLEDVAVFTAQQRSIALRPDAPQVDINADAGGIQARRIVDRLYRAEQAQLAAGVAAE